MPYTLNFAAYGAAFAVPTDVVDKHLRICGALQLKALLLLLRRGTPLTAEELADSLHQPVADIRDAMAYWVQSGLVHGDETAVKASAITENKSDGSAIFAHSFPASQPAPAHEEVVGENGRRTTIISDARRFTRAECTALAAKDATLLSLLEKSQQLMGRALTSVDMQCITALYSYYGLGADYILLVMSYCKSQDKLSMRYVERTAAGWLEQGVDTFEKADEYIKLLAHRKSNEGQVQSAFGIGGRSLTASERKYIANWYGELGYDISVIRLAYERTIENIGKLSFPYINKILTSWHSEGVRTAKDAAGLLNRGKPQPVQNGQTSYDISELEARVLRDFMQNQEE